MCCSKFNFISPILKFSDLVEHQDAPEPPAKVKIMRRQNVTENSKESSEKTTHRGIHKDKSLEGIGTIPGN